MSYLSQRSSGSRYFDSVYDPKYIVPGKRNELKAGKTALSTTSINILPKYDAIFENAPKKKDYRRQKSNLPFRSKKQKKNEVSEFEDDYVQKPSKYPNRMTGGRNFELKIQTRNEVILSPTECKSKLPGLDYFTKSNPNISVLDIKLSETKVIAPNFCARYGQQKEIIKPFKTTATQTLYRESSAQTLPYLPEVKNPINELENMELFQLSKILPGDGAPGVYEVEVLERARKRWSFAKALRDNFQRQVAKARENAKLSKHTQLLEAFEWERWIEREEYIQECQLLRLEIVIRIFNTREQEMQEHSKTCIEMAHERISAKRNAALNYNQMIYDREMRKLEYKRLNISKNWRDETITRQLGDPSSEFYAPQKRFGFDPKRRSFKPKRKEFEMEIDIEKININMKNLECPYSKLKRWAKPKPLLREVERRFCTDQKLKKLYESLKGLREQSKEQEHIEPKCLQLKRTLHTKTFPKPIENVMYDETTSLHQVIYDPEEIHEILEKKRVDDEERMRAEEYRILAAQKAEERAQLEENLRELKTEEFEALLTSYNGTAIAGALEFLSQEMDRLRLLRKFHYYSMLAQKERWQREAQEAGLRQTENRLRELLEEIYSKSNDIDEDVTDEMMRQIINDDIPDHVEETIAKKIKKIAHSIDHDIQRWLSAFGDVETLDISTLQQSLLSKLHPEDEQIKRGVEAKVVADYILEECVLENVFILLEPYDIGTATANHTIDRLFDTDLYYHSSEMSDCDSDDIKTGNKEVSAILRKLLRYCTPGRRWMTPQERVGHENAEDLLEDIFKELERMDMAKVMAEVKEPDYRVAEGGQYDFKHPVERAASILSMEYPGEKQNKFTQYPTWVKRYRSVPNLLRSTDIFKGDEKALHPQNSKLLRSRHYIDIEKEKANLNQDLMVVKEMGGAYDILSLGDHLRSPEKYDSSSVSNVLSSSSSSSSASMLSGIRDSKFRGSRITFMETFNSASSTSLLGKKLVTSELKRISSSHNIIVTPRLEISSSDSIQDETGISEYPYILPKSPAFSPDLVKRIGSAMDIGAIKDDIYDTASFKSNSLYSLDPELVYEQARQEELSKDNIKALARLSVLADMREDLVRFEPYEARKLLTELLSDIFPNKSDESVVVPPPPSEEKIVKIDFVENEYRPSTRWQRIRSIIKKRQYKQLGGIDLYKLPSIIFVDIPDTQAEEDEKARKFEEEEMRKMREQFDREDREAELAKRKEKKKRRANEKLLKVDVLAPQVDDDLEEDEDSIRY